jgi:hypothetical protein
MFSTSQRFSTSHVNANAKPARRSKEDINFPHIGATGPRNAAYSFPIWNFSREVRRNTAVASLDRLHEDS